MQITKRLPYYASIFFLAYMPFHVFLVQSLSLITGGLDAWKIAKDIVLAVVMLFVICSVWVSGRATRTFKLLLGVSAAYGLLHVMLWAVHPDIYKQSALVGLTYNLRLPAFLLLGYGTALMKPDLLERRTLSKLVLAVAGVVVVLGIAQYFLPKDILTHLGYSVERGVKPNFFIDDNPLFPRIMSTLRDPNSLGAYLIVPIALATAWMLRLQNVRSRLLLGSFVVAAMIAEFLTFSRSALAVALLATVLVVWWQFREVSLRFARRFWPLLIVFVLIIGVIGYTQRNNKQIAGTVTHATDKQVGEYDSNDYHLIFIQRGLTGIVRNPFGHGPGTAGLASIQNPKGSFLTENYYIQIGYEVGVLGLALFVALNVLVWKYLWRSRRSLLAVALLASAVAYVGMNMLLHTWSNEAVACQWWLLAGMAIAVGETYPKPQAKQPTKG
jgi:hypothetical protein